MAFGLLKDFYRSSSRVFLRILQFMPVLLSVWILTRFYALVGSAIITGTWDNLHSAFYFIAGYYFLYTILDTACLRIFEPVDFFSTWRQKHLVPTILFLPLMTTVGLIHYFSGVFGSRIYLLIVPLSVFTIVAHRIHMQRSEVNLQRLQSSPVADVHY
jgi:hypothetical protein